MKFVNERHAALRSPIHSALIAVVAICFVMACSMLTGSPTSAYKSFTDAVKAKDASAMRKYMSESSLKTLKSIADSSGKTEDEILKSLEVPEKLESQNEKIDSDGKSATVEVKDKDGKWTIVAFVKEGSWKIDLDKTRAKTDSESTKSKSLTDLSDSDKSDDSSTPTPLEETGPVSVEASVLVAEAKSMSSDAISSKYSGRLMTVTDAELWEIQSTMLHIGPKYGSYSSGYIICSGSFSDYTQYSTKIDDLRNANKSPGATIKGTFSRVSTDSGYTQVHLSPCVLSDLEKP